MIVRNFTYYDPDYSGDYDHEWSGWLLNLKDGNPAPNFDPSSGLGVAHDVLEEWECPLYKQEGLPHNELLAMGAMLFGRGHGGYFWSNSWRNEWQMVGREFPEIFDQHAVDQGMTVKTPPNTRPFTGDWDWVESDLLQAVGLGLREMDEAMKYRVRDEEEKPSTVFEYCPGLTHAANWLRIGYRRAMRRYRRLSHEEVSWLFTQIRDEVDKITEQATHGDTLKVIVNLKRKEVKVKLIPCKY